MKVTTAPAVEHAASSPALHTGKQGNTPFFGPAAGNEAPFFAPRIQTKLTIGRPSDKYEQEADAVADRVVQRLANPGATIAVQKKCQDCAEKEKLQRKEEEREEPAVMRQVEDEQEEAPVQAKAEKEEEEKPGIMRQAGPEEEEPLQAKAEAGASSTPSLQSRLSSAKGSGAPMDKSARTPMEAAFGQDFSRVRIHTDSSSAQMNRELNARAFTHGRDIYFNAGEYSPGSTEGRRLLAHELGHVGQQTGMVFRKIDDGHDLRSSRFAGDTTLEDCFDGETTRYLRVSSTGSAVVKIQQALIDLEYPMPISTKESGSPDGIFGSETKATVKKFQKDSGISQDGVVGSDTMTALDNLFAGSGPPGPAPNPTPSRFIIRTRTIFAAPNGAPNTRRTVGLGERVRLSTNLGRPVTWRIDGNANPQRPVAQTEAHWTRTGSFNIVAQNAGRTARARIRVIEPGMEPVKRRDLTLAEVRARLANQGVPPGTSPHTRGVFMEVVIRLTPNTVSFGGLTFREVGAPASGATGYFLAPGRARAHTPVANFIGVNRYNGHNVVGRTDYASFSINPVGTNLPVTAGSYRWIIPAEVQVDSITRRLPTTMTQEFRVTPRPAVITQPPLTGQFEVRKNTAHAQAIFQP